MEKLIIGNWKLHQDYLMNGHLKIDIESNQISQIEDIFFISGLMQLSEELLEVVAITEKCMVLRVDNVIYVLLRNL